MKCRPQTYRGGQRAPVVKEQTALIEELWKKSTGRKVQADTMGKVTGGSRGIARPRYLS